MSVVESVIIEFFYFDGDIKQVKWFLKQSSENVAEFVEWRTDRAS